MKHPFIPDRMFDSIHEITAEFLISCGIRAVVLDIDNTLVTYGMAKPTPEVLSWIEGLRTGGLSVAIASNNHRERVELFNEEIGAFITWESKKPSAKSIHMAASHFGVKESEIAIIGDQIFTDIWCARNAGSYAILVVPLKYKENLFFRFKRMCEKPFIRAYKKKNAKSKGDHS
jgi:HAD superfamily phosphatase (TIGR01668 family)